MRILTAISVLCLMVLNSCSREDDIISPDPLHPHQETFVSNLFVEIIDVNGNPIPETTVQIGRLQTMTNQFGIAAFSKIALGRSNYVTATAPGFISGSRRFYSEPGNSTMVKIRMMSDKAAYSFNAHSGSALTHPQGARIQFPANAYSLTSGLGYTGEVYVTFRVIQADDPQVNELMPGDLVGIDQNNATGVLGSFGMIAVEMKGEQGEELQLKEGSVATISMDIPSELQATAPPVIPLWYFDEVVGVWKEEGTATRNGNSYEGNVSHFSFWNYDAFLASIHLDLHFQQESGPLQYNKVCLNILSLNMKSCSSTNEAGYVGGPVAANELIELQVFSDCGDLLYEDVIGPFTVDTEVPAITVLESGYVPLFITGVGVNCNGAGIQNGYMALEYNGNTGFYPLGNSGEIEVSIPLCEPTGVAIQLYDFDANKESEKTSIAYSPMIDLHQVEVCQAANENFATIVPENFEVNRYYFLETRVVNGYTQILSHDSVYLPFRISVFGTTVGYYSAANGFIRVRTDLDQSLFASQFAVTLDTYGGPGELIHGVVSGTLISNDPGSGISIPFTGEFTVRRDP
jgi:hypothetical protein